MICPICKNGKTHKGVTTLIFEREESTIIYKKVPADICDNCNESFLSEKISKEIINRVNEESKKGLEIEILQYVA